MKTSIESMVGNSLAAWEGWQSMGFETRAEIIKTWAKTLADKPQAMVNFQCDNALQQVSETIEMPGPTGESNELSCAGRGAFVISAQEGTDFTIIVAQISAALVTGNTILICLPNPSKSSSFTLRNQLESAGCPEGVIEVLDYKKINGIISHTSVAGLAYAGSTESSQLFARTLAARDGLLAQLIPETDLQLLPVISSPTYAFRFITERTCTINITAVGGNAMLLELGSGGH